MIEKKEKAKLSLAMNQIETNDVSSWGPEVIHIFL